MEHVLTLTIPIPEKVSLNRIYAGVHFRERTRHKEQYHLAMLVVRPAPYTGTYPVACHYHFRLRGTALDVSNCAYMLKMTEDALVTSGVLPDDCPKYVGQITISYEKGPTDEVVVTISPIRL